MRKNICIAGELPENFEMAFSQLHDDLQMTLSASGIPVIAQKGTRLEIDKNDERIYITWDKPVQMYRALSLLSQNWGAQRLSISEAPCFETIGMMFDVSRNAVLKPETMKMFFRKMALMGMNFGMMYTEDTYEVPTQPYFGYMRGRYTQDEIREMDNYAYLFGIELCPCVQTLGHLNRALHWPQMQHLADNSEVILTDNDDTYVFLEEILTAASMPYRSKHIHIGMDEAHGIGLGEHLRKYGYEQPHDIIRRHLKKVKQITDKLGLSAMMWSDMYFRPYSPTNGYYDGAAPSQEAIDSVVDGVQLIYWDYYHNEEQEYTEMLQKHALLSDCLAFAGGIWTFAGPCPDYDKTIRTSVPALTACKKAKVPFVIATAWGDNGAETNLITALPGMQLYAEFCYTGKYDKAQLAARFNACCHGDVQAFLELSEFNSVPGKSSGWLRPVNAAKMLLYQDPLIQLFAKDFEGVNFSEHYRELEIKYREYAIQNPKFSQLYTFYQLLAEVLWRKSRWHEQAAICVQSADRDKAQKLAQELTDTVKAVENLREEWLALWNATNKPYGFEILDLRLGGICARLLTAQKRLAEYADGKEETMPELMETILPYTARADGTLFGSYAVSEIVSACKIDL
ncbi:MAG: beta-N-acetylhexosaminidase [Oscillospiraceae bacterium]